MTQQIGILVYDGFDLIDAGGPYEVFLTASRLAERDGESAAYSVLLVSPDGQQVTAYGGMKLTGLGAASEADPLDVIVVPGLVDVAAARADQRIGEAVRALCERSSLVSSVCTGAFLLADAGMLRGRPATTHWEDLGALEAEGAVGSVRRGVRWVDDGDLVTSGGLTAGIHMSLHLVDRLSGRELAARTARQLGVDWDPSGAYPAEL